MIVSELIKHLQALPQEKEISIFWDGGARGDVDGIVNDDDEVVIVGDWSIYREGEMYGKGGYRVYEEEKIVFG